MNCELSRFFSRDGILFHKLLLGMINLFFKKLRVFSKIEFLSHSNRSKCTNAIGIVPVIVKVTTTS